MWLILSGLLLAAILLVVISIRFKQKQKAARKLAFLNSELLKVSREKDKFFSIITHEIRNPLWWFKNITEMLSLKFDEMSRESLSHSLRSLDESAKNTFLLMDNLLHWTRSQLQVVPHKPEQINVNQLIEQNVVLFRSLCIQKNINLMTDCHELPNIYADKEQINTVLRNLISNAIKFTPSCGLICITAIEADRYVQIAVSDNGIGMESTIADHIFSEDFNYTTLGLMQEKGSGIGLKLCKEFVVKNGGTISITSKPSVGTTIEFSFPTHNKHKQIQALPKTNKHWRKRKFYKAKVS
jgi:signal transduction histidine kinase